MRQAMLAAFLGAGCLIPQVGCSEFTPWPVEKAARISYDPATDTFVLTNLSPHTIWYDGRSKEVGRGLSEAHGLAERNELNKLPARVGLCVKCDPNAEWGFVFSDAVIVP
jgi:hypothetical protein